MANANEENVAFNKIILRRGGMVLNENNEVLCEMQDVEGNTYEAYISLATLQECGIIEPASRPASLSREPHEQTQPATNKKTCSLWKTAKNQNEDDLQATFVLLDLRKKFERQFDDKKTAKNLLWAKIALKMNEIGYFVGEGLEGREKVRQKFANLQASYQKYLQRRQQTGEGAISQPPFFDELDAILGDKHKMVPPFIIDSENPTSTPASTSAQATRVTSDTDFERPSKEQAKKKSEAGPSTEDGKVQENRFENIKTSVRPTKSKVVDVLQKLHEENMEQRKSEFETIIQVIREENQQRHTELMAVIGALNKKDKGRKRRRSESDSE